MKKFGKNVKIGKDVEIFPNVWIGDNCVIGDNTTIQWGAFIEHDCQIGHNCRIGTNVVLRRNTKIGDYSVFGSLSASEGNNWIGNYTTIHTQVHITDNTIIEDYVFIAPLYVGANTQRIQHQKPWIPLVKEGPHIQFGARIGVAVTVLPKVNIGREALIGAGAVVTKDVPDFAIVFGSPARIQGTVPEEDRFPEHFYEEFKKRKMARI
jgi:acetyltransferase-like isoleucine patch superfamily enzyme